MYRLKEVDRKRRKSIYDIRRVERRKVIDTVWNVKDNMINSLISFVNELIGTYWNANTALPVELFNPLAN